MQNNLSLDHNKGINVEIDDVSLYGSIANKNAPNNNISFKLSTKQRTLNNTIQNQLNNQFFNNENITQEDLTELQDNESVDWPYNENQDTVQTNNKRSNSLISNLFVQRNRNDSIISFFRKDRSNTITTIKRNYYKVIRYKHFKKFISIITICFFIWVFFTLAFLPRTSLIRDFRRYHHLSSYTKEEIYRTFLDSFDSTIDDFDAMTERFSQSNNLIGDNIFTQLTYDYLKQQLGYQVSVDNHQLSDIVYDFDISIELQDTNGDSEEISINEPVLDDKIKQLGGYILGDSLEHNKISYDVSGEFIDVGIATRTDFEQLAGSPKDKIHLIKRNDKMSIDSQILNSMSYGGIGCLVYNEPGTSFDFEYVNQTITRDYLLDNSLINVPVIPISYSAASTILASDKKTLHLKRDTKKCTEYANNDLYFSNIQFTIPGIWKDHEIIVGCQRDTFTYNGYNSGNMVYLQLAKTFAELSSKGWKPIRTIRFVSFDGNTLNNMAIKEHFIKNNGKYSDSLVFVDINKDSIKGSKNFTCRTTEMFKEAITDSIDHMSLYEDDNMEVFNKESYVETDVNVGNMRTKSSLAHFLLYEHNVPTISCGFEDNTLFYPLNSNFMTKEFMERYIDKNDYQLHKLLTKFYGLLILNMDENEIVQYKMGNYMERLYDEFIDLGETKNFTDIKYWKQIEDTMNDLKIIFESFDLYNQRLLKLAYTDYPWYKGIKKIKLLFKIKASNKRMIKIKNLFLTRIRKVFEEDTQFLRFKEADNKMNLFYQVNDLEGGDIEFLGKFKEYAQVNNRQGMVKYLRDLYKDLLSIKQYILDEYPV